MSSTNPRAGVRYSRACLRLGVGQWLRSYLAASLVRARGEEDLITGAAVGSRRRRSPPGRSQLRQPSSYSPHLEIEVSVASTRRCRRASHRQRCRCGRLLRQSASAYPGRAFDLCQPLPAGVAASHNSLRTMREIERHTARSPSRTRAHTKHEPARDPPGG